MYGGTYFSHVRRYPPKGKDQLIEMCFDVARMPQPLAINVAIKISNVMTRIVLIRDAAITIAIVIKLGLIRVK